MTGNKEKDFKGTCTLTTHCYQRTGFNLLSIFNSPAVSSMSLTGILINKRPMPHNCTLCTYMEELSSSGAHCWPNDLRHARCKVQSLSGFESGLSTVRNIKEQDICSYQYYHLVRSILMKGDDLGTHGSNFFKFSKNIHLDSRMNWAALGGHRFKAQNLEPITICCYKCFH